MKSLKLVYLHISGVLKFAKEYFISLADGLNVWGGVRKCIEGGYVMIRTETKQQILKGIVRQGKNEVPCKDGGPRVTVTTCSGMSWRPNIFLVGNSLTLHLETTPHVLPTDAIDALLYKGLDLASVFPGQPPRQPGGLQWNSSRKRDVSEAGQ